MKIVILGADGFLGSNMVSALAPRKAKLTAFCPRSPRLDLLRSKGVVVIEGSFLEPPTWSIPFEGVDWLIHFATTTTPIQSVQDPVRDAANLTASKAIFRDAVDAGVKKILFSSSGGTVYGDKATVPSKETDPTLALIPYTRTKLEIERELLSRCEGTETLPVVLRYANPYGPNQYPASGTGVVTAWLESVRDNKPITLYGDGETARDFVYVADATQAALKALESDNVRGIYNIGAGVPVSLNTLLRTIEHVVDTKLEIKRLPPRSSDAVKAIALDSTRAFVDFSWKPEVPLEKGIALTWKWVQSGEKFTID